MGRHDTAVSSGHTGRVGVVGDRPRWVAVPYDTCLATCWSSALIAFFVAVGFGVLVPVLPVFARSFGVGNFAVGAVVSVFALMRLASQPVLRTAHRPDRRAHDAGDGHLHRRRLQRAGRNRGSYPELLAAGRRRAGLGDVHRLGITLLLLRVGAGLRGRAAGVYQGGFLLGGMTGPAIGGAARRWSR